MRKGGGWGRKGEWDREWDGGGTLDGEEVEGGVR